MNVAAKYTFAVSHIHLVATLFSFCNCPNQLGVSFAATESALQRQNCLVLFNEKYLQLPRNGLGSRTSQFVSAAANLLQALQLQRTRGIFVAANLILLLQNSLPHPHPFFFFFFFWAANCKVIVTKCMFEAAKVQLTAATLQFCGSYSRPMRGVFPCLESATTGMVINFLSIAVNCFKQLQVRASQREWEEEEFTVSACCAGHSYNSRQYLLHTGTF